MSSKDQMNKYIFLMVLLWLGAALASLPSRTSSSLYTRSTILPRNHHILFSLSGGSQLETKAEETSVDEERYSRQVYTLGARAHGLIRSASVLLDGPPESGLVYETAKNLALSGVRKIVLVQNANGATGRRNQESAYHNSKLDDLGRAFVRAAKQELDENGLHNLDTIQTLKHYIQRLNPSVSVSVVDRDGIAQEILHCKQGGAGGSDTEESHRVVVVAIDRPFATRVKLNELCRKHDTAFCAVDTVGVFGMVFCDFGKDFLVWDADGETPLATPLDKAVLHESDDDLLTIHCVEGEKHDVSRGDVIQFQFRDGSRSQETCTVTNVETPFRFHVRVQRVDRSAFCALMTQEAVTFSRVKQPMQLQFDSLKDAMEKAHENGSIFTACDLEKSFDHVRRNTCMAAFQTLSDHVETNRRQPLADEVKSFWKSVKRNRFMKGLEADSKKQAKLLCKAFFHGCNAKFAPLQTIFGAIAAQEALKAVSGLYNPVHQFLLYDCDEVLSGKVGKGSSDGVTQALDDSDTAGLRFILGDAAVDKLQSQKVFVVGSGAIGCEILKNLAVLGVGTGRGRIHVTDMDTIEKSNLSRQFLFRDGDIGKFKSAAAHEAIMRFSRNIKIESHSAKVGDVNQGPFDDDFWAKQVDIVLNALDNVEARLYMDAQCVANQKALVDSGTLGPKGNCQVVVPHLSESYASSADPPEQAIPVCTLKNFPYAISHTIQWGRDLFDGLFERRPSQVNSMMESITNESTQSLAEALVNDNGAESALRIARELREDITDARDVDIKTAALAWASRLQHSLFWQSVDGLLTEHPLDSVDEDGEPFWTGTRRAPKQLSYIEVSTDEEQHRINANILLFLRNAARLRMETLQLSGDVLPISEEEIQRFLRHSDDTYPSQEKPSDPVKACSEELEIVKTSQTSLNVIEFEKDDDSNGHVEFVTAASNLRAISYGIPPVDAMETRRVAGNIVPAMITTTAFVASLACLELIKLTQGAPLRLHRNAFINLALPFFAFTMPLPAEESQGVLGKTYTIWDRLVVKETKKDVSAGGVTIQSLIRRIKKSITEDKGAMAVTSISLGEYMLYANFLHDDDESVMKASLWDHIQASTSSEAEFAGRASQQSAPTHVDCQSYVDLSVAVEDLATGEEVVLPTVRVYRRKN